MNKVFSTPDEAVADIPPGATVMLGGFGLCGIPENSIAALVRRRVTGLHTISNNMGVDGFGLGLLLEAGMIASHVGSYVGENMLLEKLVIAGTLLWRFSGNAHEQKISSEGVSATRPALTPSSDFAPPPHSVAVLPFVNMSADKDQEYFSRSLPAIKRHITPSKAW